VLDGALEHNYPLEARRAGVSGRAVLRVEVLSDGHIGAVQRVTESFDGFAAACERTVRSGRWGAPLDRDGQPVATRITYTCRFEVGS
jgi:TonB family protein